MFSKVPIVADARVSPVMTHCMDCARPLPPAQSTTDHANFMILFAQCLCGKVYMLDMARFQ